MLRDIEGLDTEETARMMELTPNAVKIRLHRARQALRALLAPHFKGTTAMKCRELADFLMDYVGGELPAEVRETFEQHLTKCHNCHEYLVEYEGAVRAGKIACTSADAEVPDDVPEDLVKAIMAALEK